MLSPDRYGGGGRLRALAGRLDRPRHRKLCPRFSILRGLHLSVVRDFLDRGSPEGDSGGDPIAIHLLISRQTRKKIRRRSRDYFLEGASVPSPSRRASRIPFKYPMLRAATVCGSGSKSNTSTEMYRSYPPSRSGRRAGEKRTSPNPGPLPLTSFRWTWRRCRIQGAKVGTAGCGLRSPPRCGSRPASGNSDG